MSDKPVQHLNQQQALNFGFVLDRAPSTTFFSTDVTIPAMTIGVPEMPTPFTALKVPGDHINFEEFILNFDVDEEFRNYREIQKWMIELAFPSNFEQFKRGDRLWNTSDGTLTMLDSQKKVIKGGEFIFQGMWPMSLSSIMFSIANDNVVYAQCSVSFAYTLFTMKD